MFKPFIVIASISTFSLDLPKEEKFFLDGDYTLEANEFLNKKTQKNRDLNDVLYEAIAREIEEGKNNKQPDFLEKNKKIKNKK